MLNVLLRRCYGVTALFYQGLVSVHSRYCARPIDRVIFKRKVDVTIINHPPCLNNHFLHHSRPLVVCSVSFPPTTIVLWRNELRKQQYWLLYRIVTLCNRLSISYWEHLSIDLCFSKCRSCHGVRLLWFDLHRFNLHKRTL